MFKNNFIAVIKANGKILRELDGYVTLPFNSEFTILLKNKDSRKAVVAIEVDGEDVLDGVRLIVSPNEDLELEGFKKESRVTNRFKFIQKTKEIVEHRGDRIDDGFIRIEVTFEEKVVTERKKVCVEPWQYPWQYPWTWTISSKPWRLIDNMQEQKQEEHIGTPAIYMSNMGGGSSYIAQNVSLTCDSFPEPKQDEGITVKGSRDVDQRFVTGYTHTLEKTSSVIIIRLRGTTRSGGSVVEPITTKTKLECPTCGRTATSSFKFCANCGTSLR